MSQCAGCGERPRECECEVWANCKTHMIQYWKAKIDGRQCPACHAEGKLAEMQALYYNLLHNTTPVPTPQHTRGELNEEQDH